MSDTAPHRQSEKPSTLEEAAHTFSASLTFSAVLERHREAILTLRARGASITQIQDILNEYGVTVSEWAITRFCRKYRIEWRRLQSGEEYFHAPTKSPKATQPPPAVAATMPESHTTLSAHSKTSTPTATPQPHKKTFSLRGDF